MIYVDILKAIKSLRFPVGKKLLIEFLLGDENIKTIKYGFNKNIFFGILKDLKNRDVEDYLDLLLFNGLIEKKPLSSNRFVKTLNLTNKGLNELKNPKLNLDFKSKTNIFFNKIKITESDLKIFKNFSELNSLNNEQKKAVICSKKRILCIAGAGTGKTTVLSKRIMFLVKYRGVDPNKILAITFTRKARDEMKKRILANVEIETFNSFGEKILKKYSKQIYSSESNVLDSKLRIKLFNESLKKLNININDAINIYFSDKKIRAKDPKTLYFSLLNDVYSLIDYYHNKWENISALKKLIDNNEFFDKKKAELIYKIAKEIELLKKQFNLHDYTEQVMHAISFFKKNPDKIPVFDHILIDEYQDINDLQIELIDILNPKNLFVVGDPRQSIYGWRNAKIEHIFSFDKKYKNSGVIELTKNYRSTPEIINVANKVIKNLSLSDLDAVNPSVNDSVIVLKHKTEEAEAVFIAQTILAKSVKPNEIFILARTNKQLEFISDVLTKYGIKHIKKSIESIDRVPSPNDVVLSTVHAIKGLEAKWVFVAGATSFNYPCKVSEHPIMEIIKADEDYNKIEEERRLFYVAVTRAKEKLIISYYGTPSRFIPKNLIRQDSSLLKYGDNVYLRLKKWRRDIAQLYRTTPHNILSDSLLRHVADLKPKNIQELETIPGFSFSKINKFGDDLIELINKTS